MKNIGAIKYFIHDFKNKFINYFIVKYYLTYYIINYFQDKSSYLYNLYIIFSLNSFVKLSQK